MMETSDAVMEQEFGGGEAGAAVAPEDLAQVVVNGNIDASLFDGVDTVGNLIPVGTKCRWNIRNYRTGTVTPWTWAGKAAMPESEPFGAQPYFNIEFVCQQEPWPGKRIFYFCPWINDKTKALAAAGDANAIRVKKRLLGNAKGIMEGADYKPTGKFDFETFLKGQPDVGIEVRHGFRKEKDGSQGRKEEQVQCFVPLSKLR